MKHIFQSTDKRSWDQIKSLWFHDKDVKLVNTEEQYLSYRGTRYTKEVKCDWHYAKHFYCSDGYLLGRKRLRSVLGVEGYKPYQPGNEELLP